MADRNIVSDDSSGHNTLYYAQEWPRLRQSAVIRTLKDYLAAGHTSEEAIAYVFRVYDIVLPHPGLAKAMARAVPDPVLIPGRDGYWHDGRRREGEVERQAFVQRIFQLVNALEALATLPDIMALVDEIPSYCAYRLEQRLGPALVNLHAVADLWEKRRRAEACPATDTPGQVAE